MKTIHPEDIIEIIEWECPFVSCGRTNEAYDGYCPSEGEVIQCDYCNRKVKVKG